MDWRTVFQVLLPFIIKLLQGLAQLPPEAQQQFAQAFTAGNGEGDGFNPHEPQPGEQFAQQAQPAEQMGALPRRHVDQQQQ